VGKNKRWEIGNILPIRKHGRIATQTGFGGHKWEGSEKVGAGLGLGLLKP
jgi:hypothetical protein